MSNIKEAVKDELTGFNLVFNILLWGMVFYFHFDDRGVLLSSLLSFFDVVVAISLTRFIASKIFKESE